jgi:hypothetical protein
VPKKTEIKADRKAILRDNSTAEIKSLSFIKAAYHLKLA